MDTYPSMSVGDPDAAADIVCCDRLAGMVTSAFPTLSITDRRLEQSGGDHVVLIIDEHLAFRFPREAARTLEFEIKVLEHLRRRSDVPVPTYEYVGPAYSFGGYALIHGAALTPHRFAGFSGQEQAEIMQSVAALLSELHGLSPAAIAPLQQWPRPWTARECADRGLTEYLPRLAGRLPDQAGRIGTFYARYREMEAPAPVIVHGDLVCEHLLVDRTSGCLTGVIDFGDVALGDPAQDFAGLWSYGSAAAAQAVQSYRSAASDPGLLDRSRQHFIRYRLDHLLGRIPIGNSHDLHQVVTDIEAVLSVRPPDVSRSFFPD